MQMGFDHPWFILLWIVCLSIVMLPILVGGINAIVNNYFNAKEKHIFKIVKAIGEVMKGISSEKTEETRDENKQ